MMKKLLPILLLLFPIFAWSQVISVRSGPNGPTTSAPNYNKGGVSDAHLVVPLTMIIPVFTTPTFNNATPVNGAIGVNTATNQFVFYSNGAWRTGGGGSSDSISFRHDQFLNLDSLSGVPLISLNLNNIGTGIAHLGVDVNGALKKDTTLYEQIANKAVDFSTINNTLYPTTQAVNDLVTNSLAVGTNGLNGTQSIGLGGTVSSNTLISINSSLIFRILSSFGSGLIIGDNASNIKSFDGAMYSGAISTLSTPSIGSQAQMEITDATPFPNQQSSITILENASGATKGINIRDDIYSKGAYYFADYSANFTARSLIDKGYGDAHYAAIGGSGVTSFNTRTGAVTLSGTDVTTALTFTPENVANKETTLTNSTTFYPTGSAVQTYVTGLGYITGNQTITLSGDVTGSGTTAITTAIKSNVALAGSPTTTTQTTGDNTTKIATDAFVQAALGAGGITINNASIPIGGALNTSQGSFNNAPTQYEGLVGTRAMTPNNYNASSTQFMSRSPHFATTNITTLKIAIPNFYLNETSGGAETGTGTTATVTAGIEYPSGTFTQVEFSGSASGTIPNLSFILSDYVNVTIPAGSEFWVRIYIVNAGGLVYNSIQPVSNIGAGQNSGTSGIADLTVTSGTIASSNTVLAPMAIIGYTNQPSVIGVGDSRIEGLGDQTANLTGNYGDIFPSFGTNYGYAIQPDPGQTLASFMASHTNQVAMWKYATHIIDAYQYNDFWSTGQTAATGEAQALAFAQLVHQYNKKVWNITIGTKTTSTDSWATTTNQTVANSTINTAVIAYNTWIRAGANSQDGYFEIATPEQSALNSGKWIVNGTANYATSDGIHESSVINQTVIPASGSIPANTFTTPFAYVNGSAIALRPFSVNQAIAGVAGTDSVWVHDNTTKQLRLISPTYYQSTAGAASTYLPLTGGTLTNTTLPQLTIVNTGSNQTTFAVGSTGNLTVTSSGGQFITSTISTNTIRNTTASTNAMTVYASTGITSTRNVASDANAVYTINNAGSSATGDILDLQAGGTTLAKFDISGNLTTPKVNGNTFTTGTGTLTLGTGSTLQTTGAFTLNQTLTANSTPTYPTGTGTLLYTTGSASGLTGTLPIASGGTGIGTAPALGSIPYGSTSTALAYVAPNTTSTQKFLTETGTGSVGAIPVLFDLYGNNNTWGGANTFNGAIGVGGNFNVVGSSSSGSINSSTLLLDGASNINVRTYLSNTSVSTAMSANNSYANNIVGSGSTTTASTGTSALITNFAVRAPVIVITSGSTVTDAASLYSQGGVTGATNTWNGWFKYGVTRVSGLQIDSSANVPINKSSADLTAQTTAANVTTFTVGSSTATFNISGYVNITAVTVDVIEMQVTYTDENSTSQTANFFTQGATSALLSAIGNSVYPPMTIRAKNGTVITVKTTLTTGTGSIAYDAGGRIQQL